MKIAVASYRYGTSATGICVERIVNGLASSGCDIDVFAGDCRQGLNSEGLVLHQCAQWPSRPGGLFELLGNIAQVDLQHLAWRQRAQHAVAAHCRDTKADCIYAVASPVASLLAGLNASRRTGLPLVAHFMDPIPAPEAWVPGNAYRKRMINTARLILDHAAAVVFLTEETACYQQKVTGMKIAHKSRVIPNIAPPWKELAMPAVSPDPEVFLYLGSFYRHRKPDTLIEGFSRLLPRYPGTRLRFVGADPKSIQPYLTSKAVSAAVEILPRTHKVEEAMAGAAVLVDVDAPDREPVFLSTKLLDYLSVNRVILSISPTESPASRLLARDSHTVVMANHDPNEIAAAMELSLKMSRSMNGQDYAGRRAAYSFLSPRAVTEALESCFSAVISAKDA